MKKNIVYTSQTRLDFDLDSLVNMGIQSAFVVPFTSNNECLAEPRTISTNLEKLADKARKAAEKGINVYPFFVTINHPDGNYEVPDRYRRQRNLDGSERSGFICFLDKVRQQEMIELAAKAAKLDFERLAFDDDLRDAFCYCDEHINGFEGFKGKSRREIEQILNGVLTNPEYEQLRIKWYEYKYQGMTDYARRIEQAVHKINPKCQIGICNSAKRCQDFSGRRPWQWAQLFHTDQAPTFVRLCGECYNDNLLSLAQSVGWHIYFAHVYPETIETKLEVTSVSDIGYRSPYTVLLEAETLIAATGNNVIHWAWTGDFDATGLHTYLGPAKTRFEKTVNSISERPQSELVQFIGEGLGPYLPPDISIPYGAIYDPISAFNIISLAGLPILPMPIIPVDQPAIICSAHISRAMIEQIDEYVQKGGVAILDAAAARCYRLYGGKTAFSVAGPVSRHRYEIAPDGERENMCKDCKPETIYLIENCLGELTWKGYDIENALTGITTAIVSCSKGKLILFGYDLSLTGSKLIRPELRERIIKMLSFTGVEFSAYWAGPVAAQCFYFGSKIALVNYNTNSITGELISHNNQIQVTLEPLKLKIVSC